MNVFSQNLSLCDETGFDINDFHHRWKKARLAAIRQQVSLDDFQPIVGGDPLRDEELALLLAVPDDLRSKVTKGVFDNSRKLGLNVTRYLGLSWEIDDIVEVLKAGGIHCCQGVWTAKAHAHVLTRAGCPQVRIHGSFICDYWREALDGLVMGVGESERFVRHQSQGHKDASCVDVIFNDAQSPGDDLLKWGKIPETMQFALDEICARFSAFQVKLEWLGLKEGIIFYRLSSSAGPLCGTSGKLHHDKLRRDLHSVFPGLELADASPLAVYGEGT